MSEISLYEAQVKKMQGLCDEHDLTYRFKKDRYPITFTIKPVQGVEAQMSMLENEEEVGYRSPDASMTWIFEDGTLTTKVQGGCQRRCDFVVFRRTGNVEKWRVNVYSP